MCSYKQCACDVLVSVHCIIIHTSKSHMCVIQCLLVNSSFLHTREHINTLAESKRPSQELFHKVTSNSVSLLIATN